MLSNYWWGQKQSERKIHWISWKKLARSKWERGMGFRDLKFFNLALLARQCWKIIHNPHSLLFWVLKSKYFPNSSFLEARVAKRTSFAWKSIMGAREVIDLGSRWCVGSGSRIHIWRDRWIPTKTTFKIQSLVKILTKNATIDSLIQHPTRQWNVPLIDAMFSTTEAATIKSIPLSIWASPDVLIWSETKNGVYLVKSAYHLLIEVNQARDVGESSNISHGRLLWKDIWSASVPQKIKLFIWRACKGILPTNLSLYIQEKSTKLFLLRGMWRWSRVYCSCPGGLFCTGSLGF